MNFYDTKCSPGYGVLNGTCARCNFNTSFNNYSIDSCYYYFANNVVYMRTVTCNTGYVLYNNNCYDPGSSFGNVALLIGICTN